MKNVIKMYRAYKDKKFQERLERVLSNNALNCNARFSGHITCRPGEKHPITIGRGISEKGKIIFSHHQ